MDREGHELDPPGEVRDRPFVVECKAGKYAYCRCKQSRRYPFCDGTHRDLDDPERTPIKILLDEAQTIAWCACGKSGNAPYCDGSHAGP